ncbi:hypothetical protein BTN50_1157 [Candidatus Enterovibrio altilux]|uniref:Mobile element protein n=1 Tax=Candidatus Enterovibrio altilux TaxID=1927128 RepID=A0A291B9F0_9GAMM|nr:hypothetical protein BTN50_1157 [Candidatus Enterovibrio luxaltus]
MVKRVFSIIHQFCFLNLLNCHCYAFTIHAFANEPKWLIRVQCED